MATNLPLGLRDLSAKRPAKTMEGSRHPTHEIMAKRFKRKRLGVDLLASPYCRWCRGDGETLSANSHMCCKQFQTLQGSVREQLK
eukprot:s2553_g2.t1